MSDKEFVLSKYPEAFAYYDDDGNWWVSMILGEAPVDDEEKVEDVEPRVWADAAERIRERQHQPKCKEG